MIFIKICLEVLELLRQTRNKLPILLPAILDRHLGLVETCLFQ